MLGVCTLEKISIIVQDALHNLASFSCPPKYPTGRCNKDVYLFVDRRTKLRGKFYFCDFYLTNHSTFPCSRLQPFPLVVTRTRLT